MCSWSPAHLSQAKDVLGWAAQDLPLRCGLRVSNAGGLAEFQAASKPEPPLLTPIQPLKCSGVSERGCGNLERLEPVPR